jgi:hypothetical protein
MRVDPLVGFKIFSIDIMYTDDNLLIYYNLRHGLSWPYFTNWNSALSSVLYLWVSLFWTPGKYLGPSDEAETNLRHHVSANVTSIVYTENCEP